MGPLIRPAKRGAERHLSMCSGRLPVEGAPEGCAAAQQVWDYLDLWDWDGTMARIDHALRCRRRARDHEREARKAAAFVRRAMIRPMLRRLAATT